MSRIFRKTLLAVVVVFGVSANATALLSAWLLHHHLSVESVAKGRAIAMAIAAASPDALVGGDGASLQSMIDEFLRIDLTVSAGETTVLGKAQVRVRRGA